ncbi:LysR substrate-binding domain-containing protein [Microbulbifer sp. MLAF003]|uniref:LysR family transcriptional regulator n=1 Tax=Microbulbifer sp. MLAF003 TaxID=3032582 RepID=UPI0024AE5669|nr:LysR family transcriptional regulator [Microbulbifer sp. MLAF003]WHI53294.1 LysR substrate-binding domain-containing protein [Microbulbifer sp. MLAF003]
MDKLDAMRLYVRIVERGSFTAASSDLDVPRSTSTQVINKLEKQLGVRLLQRSTRKVKATLDGELYYQRCLSILSDVEEAEGAFKGSLPKGEVRVDVQGTIARYFVMPKLPQFFERYPDITLVMSEGDRWVDLVQEGVDCAIRYGHLADSELIARRLTMLDRLTCASPGYLERYGTPKSLRDLSHHRAVALRSITTGKSTPLSFCVGDKVETMEAIAPITVTGTESYRDAVKLGIGLAQFPRFHVEKDLTEGNLIEVLPNIRPPSEPVSVVFTQNRFLSPRVRTFIEWLTEIFADH